MQSKDGVSHRVIENYTQLPKVHFVSAKRFGNNRVKVTKQANSSPMLEINDVTYYLKAVVKHSGSLFRGHYTTALNTKTLWVFCDDSNEFKITNEIPIYKFCYC